MSGGAKYAAHSLTVVLIFCFAIFPANGTGQDLVVGISLRRDQEVLIQLRNYLLETNRFHRGTYTEWNQSDPSPCNWTGITCEHGRVARIDLRDSSITGAILPGLSNLTELSHLDLSKNTISGAVPPSLNRCAKLRHLNLSHNTIGGGLNLSGLHQLEAVGIAQNRFTGEIQPDFAGICGNLVTFNVSLNGFSSEVGNLFDGCPKLKHLDLSGNDFTGDLWPGFSRLEQFSVSDNNIVGAIKPEFFPSGCRLRALDLSMNGLRGEFPNSIANCSNLTTLDLRNNRFSGLVPSGIGLLPELDFLSLGSNSFDRRIPEELRDCPKLVFLDLSENSFGGEVQRTLGRFTQIRFLVLHGNNYTGGIESSGILKLPELVRLDLSFNKFSGPLSPEIARMQKLRFLILAYNNFSGGIPAGIGMAASLQGLDLSYNSLSGLIPPSIGNLKSLLWLMLANNSLSGQIPPEIGNCRSLLWLNLANNQISGGIPRSIQGMGSDPGASFERNRKGRLTTGPGDCLMMRRWIPADYPPYSFMYTIMTRGRCRSTLDILRMGYGLFPLCGSNGQARSMSGYLQLTGNRLTGEIPPEIGRMTWLSVVLLCRNGFSGRLPPEIGRISLLVLNVSSNQISGPIPPEIGGAQCLFNLDLSSNNFSGEIPLSLGQLSEMSRFNVSFNPFLQGRIPCAGQLATFGEGSYLGNPLLEPCRWRRSPHPPPPSGSWSPPEGEGRSSPWRSGPFFVSLGAAVGFFPVGFYLGTRLYSKKISPFLSRRAGRRRRRR